MLAEAPETDEAAPAAQGRQSRLNGEPRVDEYDPTAQLTQAVELVAAAVLDHVPATQALQLAPPLDHEPGVQAAQTALPTAPTMLDAVPAEQVKHAAEAVAAIVEENVPGEHNVQARLDDAVSEADQVPAGHEAQAADPVAAQRPAPQLAHAVLLDAPAFAE